MNVIIENFPIQYVVIDDVYTEEELNLIWSELDMLTPMMQSEETLGTSTDSSGNYKKKGKGIFLNEMPECFVKTSNILKFNRNIFGNEIVSKIKHLENFSKYICFCNGDTTLINRYVDGDYYGPHTDDAILTALTFFIDDFGFNGGSFKFTDYNHTIEQRNNRTIIFPSNIKHEVEPIHLNSNSKGRFSMAQFLYHQDKQ